MLVFRLMCNVQAASGCFVRTERELARADCYRALQQAVKLAGLKRYQRSNWFLRLLAATKGSLAATLRSILNWPNSL
jgi:hypothetical protein